MKKILIMLLSMIFLLTGCNIMGSDSNGNLKLDNDEETVIDMNTPERNNNKEIAQNYADELFQEYLKKNEIEVLIEDFNTMVQELQSTEILKSDFISNVSHEIKAPLSVIQSYSTALKDPTLTHAVNKRNE